MTETLIMPIERPILYSTPMVQAIQDDRKTQTRRQSGLEVVNADPDDWELTGVHHDTPDTHVFAWFKNKQGSQLVSAKCPYGKPGDELWVKEMFYAYGHWQQTENDRWEFVDLTGTDFTYRYHDNPPERIRRGYSTAIGWYKRNSLFMPKVASRILLRITDIRVERLQDINREDAIAEGMPHEWEKLGPSIEMQPDPPAEYALLWMKLNGDESWEYNPWVWVVSFDRMEKGGVEI